MPYRLFLFLALLPCPLAAQQYTYDHIIFWDSMDWDRTDFVYYYPQQQAVPLAVRWYYGDRRDIREEFIRIDGEHWLFNSYDTTGALQFRRGQMRIDREHPQIDSMITFDQETYEEIVQIDTSWRLKADGFWQESDADGFLWSGMYLDGLRQGPWSKVRALPHEVYDLRSITFTDGRPGPEIQLNLALGRDSTAITRALLGAWVDCGNYMQLATWRKWDGDYPDNCWAHHGSVIYWFQPDQRVQRCYPSGFGLEFRTESGRWSIDNAANLHLFWESRQESASIPIRSLLDKELRLDYRK